MTNKTVPTDTSVRAYLDAIDDPARRADCDRLVEIMQRVTGESPVMWGSSIVGFGSYHYVYDSGREGDMCLTGFSSRKAALSIYVMTGFDDQPERMELGTSGPLCVGAAAALRDHPAWLR